MGECRCGSSSSLPSLLLAASAGPWNDLVTDVGAQQILSASMCCFASALLASTAGLPTGTRLRLRGILLSAASSRLPAVDGVSVIVSSSLTVGVRTMQGSRSVLAALDLRNSVELPMLRTGLPGTRSLPNAPVGITKALCSISIVPAALVWFVSLGLLVPPSQCLLPSTRALFVLVARRGGRSADADRTEGNANERTVPDELRGHRDRGQAEARGRYEILDLVAPSRFRLQL